MDKASKEAAAEEIRQQFVRLRNLVRNRVDERSLNTLIAEQIVASDLKATRKLSALVEIIAGTAGVRFDLQYELNLPKDVTRALLLSTNGRLKLRPFGDNAAASHPAGEDRK